MLNATSKGEKIFFFTSTKNRRRANEFKFQQRIFRLQRRKVSNKLPEKFQNLSLYSARNYRQLEFQNCMIKIWACVSKIFSTITTSLFALCSHKSHILRRHVFPTSNLKIQWKSALQKDKIK